MQKKHLTIVGAGISGLYLAYLLQEDFEITILEARERVGGRIFSLDGHDMGPSWIWPHHTNVLELIENLGLKLFRQYTKGYALYDTKDKVEIFNAPASSPSFRVEGTLSQLVETLHQNLKNVKIYYGHVVESIEVEANSVSIKTSKKSYESDAVVVTLPPRLAANLRFTPKLPSHLDEKMKQMQTWMGNSAKCVVEFKTPFWRDRGLSGFAFSHVGPLGEIHDASTANKPALFGFVNLNAEMQHFETNVRAQMKRLFKIEDSEIVKIYLVDWKREVFSSVKEDASSRGAHPQYGIDMSSYSQRVYFGATEFSYEEGGYIEGAIRQAIKIAKQLSR
jgi:monoamine oxidase